MIDTTIKLQRTSKSRNLPKIPQSFISLYIEEYNKGNIITKIDVEYEPCGVDSAYRQYYSLKINPDNTISIKPLKDSWNREEVISLLEEVLNTFCKSDCYDLDNWIKQNL